MLVSTCDVCHMTRNFSSETERRVHGWKCKDNYVVCVACRLKKIEDALATGDAE